MKQSSEICEGEAWASLVVVTSGWSCGVASNGSHAAWYVRVVKADKARVNYMSPTPVTGCTTLRTSLMAVTRNSLSANDPSRCAIWGLPPCDIPKKVYYTNSPPIHNCLLGAISVGPILAADHAPYIYADTLSADQIRLSR